MVNVCGEVEEFKGDWRSEHECLETRGYMQKQTNKRKQPELQYRTAGKTS